MRKILSVLLASLLIFSFAACGSEKNISQGSGEESTETSAQEYLLGITLQMGVTAKAAWKLSEAAGADLYEIQPEIPYSREDLDWMDKKSRSSVEMNDPAFRPVIAGKMEDMDQYEVVFVGFPIWWYVAPKIINTFLESYDFSGKTIVTFATSGGSGMGNTNDKLAPSCPGAILLEGKMLNGVVTQAELKAWVESL